jgi:uncharacterized protein YbaR (Trm112 family)
MILQLDDLLPILQCPVSKEPLSRRGEKLVSPSDREYPLVHGIPILFPDVRIDDPSLPASYKDRTPKESRLELLMYRILSVAHTPEAEQAMRDFCAQILKKPGSLVLVIGGGAVPQDTKSIYESDQSQVISLDIYASSSTNVCADAHTLPIQDSSIDFILIQAVLEHVFSPQQVVSEIHRVLKPGGVVYADTPFMYPVHEGAYDFTRFSLTGHRWLFRRFTEISSGPSLGVGSTFMLSARYFFKALTGSRVLAAALTVPFALAKKLEPLIARQYHVDAGAGMYFVGAKFDGEITQADVISGYAGAQRD